MASMEATVERTRGKVGLLCTCNDRDRDRDCCCGCWGSDKLVSAVSFFINYFSSKEDKDRINEWKLKVNVFLFEGV